MKTLGEMVEEVAKGAKRVDDQVMVDKLYDAKCYRAGEVIRVDLKPAKPLCSAQGHISG